MPCQFRRGKELSLGPLKVRRPLFMEMDVSGIVSGSPEPVAGIIGFDAFKAAVLEVEPGATAVRLHDPTRFSAPSSWRWQPLLMVGQCRFTSG